MLLAGLGALAACGLEKAQTPASAPTATLAVSATPSPTPSPTPTPTATAPPAAISGDVRSLSFGEPVRQNGAPCGFVDTLDFPMDPPDGTAASGGGDFARFRERYDAYHAGEDWRLGSSSFGKPVYSIGHGRITYAQPLGWGPDKGVVIVEHTFRDHRRLLSFYGHLDPPSVILRAGQCVQRGDQLGAVGDPRTRPHLHFELRLHLPDTPGPGYWPVDPRLAGWRPPSATIWLERMRALPGVGWTWLSDRSPLQVLGRSGEQVLLLSDGELLALDLADGTRSWSHPLPELGGATALDAAGDQLYLDAGNGAIEAFALADLALGRREPAVQPTWRAEAGAALRYELFPLPEGGVVAIARSQAVAISADGVTLWRATAPTRIDDWAQSGSTLVLAGTSGTWTADAGGMAAWGSSTAGERVAASAQPYLYADDGIYRLDMELQTAKMFFPLPEGFARLGDLADLPDGGLLAVHRDLDDTRLLAIEPDGSLRWERSIRALEARGVELLELDGQALLLVQRESGGSVEIEIFAIGQEDGALLRVFSAGSRNRAGAPIVLAAEEDMLLIGIEGVGYAAWAPQTAIETVMEQN